MSMKERVGHAMDRMFDRMRHRDAFQLGFEGSTLGTFDGLRGKKYAVLVTFRRNGEAVPSPVWVAVDDAGRAYVRTMQASGKVKRAQHDARVLLAPASARGRPSGPAVQGIARVLPTSEWPHAEDTLASAYGLGRRVYEGVVGDAEGIASYLEITPTG